MKIKRVEVVENEGPDIVRVFIEGRHPFTDHKDDPYLKTEAPKGKGAEWVRKTFGVEPVLLEIVLKW